MAVLRLQSVMVSKRFAENDVIEHLDNPNAAPVGLVRQERKYFLVLLECLFIYFQSEGIVLQFHQRGKGMTIPQVERIVFVLYHHVEVFHPFRLVVEPREVLRRIGILVDGMAREIDGLL